MNRYFHQATRCTFHHHKTSKANTGVCSLVVFQHSGLPNRMLEDVGGRQETVNDLSSCFFAVMLFGAIILTAISSWLGDPVQDGMAIHEAMGRVLQMGSVVGRISLQGGRAREQPCMCCCGECQTGAVKSMRYCTRKGMLCSIATGEHDRFRMSGRERTVGRRIEGR